MGGLRSDAVLEWVFSRAQVVAVALSTLAIARNDRPSAFEG